MAESPCPSPELHSTGAYTYLMLWAYVGHYECRAPGLRLLMWLLSAPLSATGLEKSTRRCKGAGVLFSPPDASKSPSEVQSDGASCGQRQSSCWKGSRGPLLSQRECSMCSFEPSSGLPTVSICMCQGMWSQMQRLGRHRDKADEPYETSSKLFVREVSCGAASSACKRGGEWQKALWLLPGLHLH